MRVDTMRKIDRWIGVPLCWFSTILFRIKAVVVTQPKITPQNVLLIELSEMGSTILADPAMRKLKHEFKANLFFAIFTKNKSSLFLLNTVHANNIITIRENGLFGFIVDTFRFVVWTRRNRIDTVIDLELFSRFTALLSAYSGAGNRVGFHAFHNEGLYRGEMLTHKVAYNPHMHIAKNFVAMVNALLSPKREVPYSKTFIDDVEIKLPTLTYSDLQVKSMHQRIQGQYPQFNPEMHRIVIINPNASELLVQRRWMPEYYVRLIITILDQYSDVLVLVTGAPAERDEAQDLCHIVNRDRCINFAGQLKLIELPILYSITTLMVSNDSGPGHFSSITKMPSFILFGPETPALYASLGNSTPIYAGLACSPCVSAANHRKTACTDNQCLKVIQPEVVFEKIRPVLDEHPN